MCQLPNIKDTLVTKHIRCKLIIVMGSSKLKVLELSGKERPWKTGPVPDHVCIFAAEVFFS
jgi:hypothetical protein